MDKLTARLRQLESLELKLYAERDRFLFQRSREDELLQRSRAKEDENWIERLRQRDEEHTQLRQRRRQLAISSPASSEPRETSELPKTSTPRTSQSLNPTNNLPILSTHPAARKVFVSSSTSSNKRRIEEKKSSSTDDFLVPLVLIRPSDGQAVHLHCCIDGCDKMYFCTITALRKHVAKDSLAKHHGQRRLFSSVDEIIEACGCPVTRQKDQASFDQAGKSDLNRHRTSLDTLHADLSLQHRSLPTQRSDLDPQNIDQDTQISHFDSERIDLDSWRAEQDPPRANLDLHHTDLDTRRADIDPRRTNLHNFLRELHQFDVFAGNDKTVGTVDLSEADISRTTSLGAEKKTFPLSGAELSELCTRELKKLVEEQLEKGKFIG